MKEIQAHKNRTGILANTFYAISCVRTNVASVANTNQHLQNTCIGIENNLHAK